MREDYDSGFACVSLTTTKTFIRLSFCVYAGAAVQLSVLRVIEDPAISRSFVPPADPFFPRDFSADVDT